MPQSGQNACARFAPLSAVFTCTTTASFLVEPGQTLLIGGLKRTGNQSVEKGLPVIGDIPLVGSLFTPKHLAGENRLLILVTPVIVDAP